jgi:hypothetical protein
MIKRMLMAMLVIVVFASIASAQYYGAEHRLLAENAQMVNNIMDAADYRQCVRHQGVGDWTDLKCRFGADYADRAFRVGRYAVTWPGEGANPQVGYGGNVTGPYGLTTQGAPYGSSYGYAGGQPYGSPYGYGGGYYGGYYNRPSARGTGAVIGGIGLGAAGYAIGKNNGGRKGGVIGAVIGGTVGLIAGAKAGEAWEDRGMRREMERELKYIRMRNQIFQEMEQEAERHAPQQPQTPAPTPQVLPAPSQPAQTEQMQARRLCNRSGHLVVLYDGDEKLMDLPTGWAVQLPPDTYLDARTDACELQGTEQGADINLSCR